MLSAQGAPARRCALIRRFADDIWPRREPAAGSTRLRGREAFMLDRPDKNGARPGNSYVTGRRAEFFVFAIIAAFIWPISRRRGRRVWFSDLDDPDDPGASRPSGRMSAMESRTFAPRTVSRSAPFQTGRGDRRRLSRRSRHRVPLLRRRRAKLQPFVSGPGLDCPRKPSSMKPPAPDVANALPRARAGHHVGRGETGDVS